MFIKTLYINFLYTTSSTHRKCEHLTQIDSIKQNTMSKQIYTTQQITPSMSILEHLPLNTLCVRESWYKWNPSNILCTS